MPKEYYEEIHWFRGFAIFSIVLGHFRMVIYDNLSEPVASGWNNLLSYIALAYSPGGTTFFVFISGFLFYAIFYKRGIEYKNFIRKKLINVFSPYLIFVSSLGIWQIISLKPGFINSDFIFSIFFYWSFWYIPFIMCIFMITPIFELLVKLKKKYQLLILALTILLSLAIGRHTLNPILACCYFFSVYFLGILTALNYNYLQALNSKLKWSFFYLYLGFSTILIALGITPEAVQPVWHIDFFHKSNLSMLSKLICCILYLWVFLYLKGKKLGWVKKILDCLAKYSFTIFFFQQFALFWFQIHPPKPYLVNIAYWQIQVLAVISTAAFCALTILLFAPLKRLLGRYSRMIIGC